MRFGLHLLLITIAAAFLFPFVWMIVTSAKTDEEIAAEKWLPALPRFCAASPHDYTDFSGRPQSAALRLNTLQIRSLDAHIFNVRTDWKVVDERGSIIPGEQGFEWHYSFASANDPPTVVQCSFDLPVEPAELHKLILAITPDDSWNRIDCELLVDGTAWRSARPTYLAQHRPTSVMFQPPTFEDETSPPKTWVGLERGRGLRAEGRAGLSESTVLPASAPMHRATLRLVLSPSSTPRAIWGKFTRNYLRIFDAVPFWRYVLNSVLLSSLVVLGSVLSSTFIAYAFARLHWPGRSAAFVLLLATMMLPAQVTMIPSFLIWRQIGWYNTLNPMWTPAFFGSAFFIFMMVQHMKTIPRELEEAARIDGLNHVQTWYYIMLPHVKPAAAAVAVLAFLGAWNDFLGPLIYLRDQSRFPLSLGLLAAQIENRGDWSLIMAGNVLLTLPVIVIFFLGQRYFVQGVAMSGGK